MGTYGNNRINAALTAADITAINSALDVLFTKLGFAIGLTVSERVALPKMNNTNKTFTEDAIAAAKANPQFMPAYFKVADLEKDLVLFEDLDKILIRVRQLFEILEDTQMLSGSEAYVGGLIFYRLCEGASRAGIPGADEVYKFLRSRFEGQGNFNTDEPTPDEPVDPVPPPPAA